jgi:hypothetical protein
MPTTCRALALRRHQHHGLATASGGKATSGFRWLLILPYSSRELQHLPICRCYRVRHVDGLGAAERSQQLLIVLEHDCGLRIVELHLERRLVGPRQEVLHVVAPQVAELDYVDDTDHCSPAVGHHSASNEQRACK